MAGANNGTQETWEEFYSARCICHRDQLIVIYLPVVDRVARKVHRRVEGAVELEELVSFGTFGLIKAVDIYDPFRGVGFETVAAAHIRGHILDEIRSADWAPRSVRRRQREVDHAVEALEAALGREPTSIEIAQFLGITAQEVTLRVRETSTAKVASLDEPITADGTLIEVEDHSASYDPLERREIMAMADRALRSLPPQQRLLIALHYFERMPLPEAAPILGVSPSKARQLHTEAVTTIREQLARSLVA